MPDHFKLDRSMGRLCILGLYKSHGGGANAIFNAEEVERFKELVKDEPRRIRHAKAVLEEETEKKFSEYPVENGEKPREWSSSG